MARVAYTSGTSTTLTVCITDLGYAESTYSGFRVSSNNGVSWTDISRSNSSSNFFTNNIILSLSETQAWTIRGQANSGGTWYEVTSLTILASVSNISMSRLSQNSVTLNWTVPIAGTSYTNYDKSWDNSNGMSDGYGTYDGYITNNSSSTPTTGTVSFSDLYPNTTVTIYLQVQNANSQFSRWKYYQFTTPNYIAPSQPTGAYFSCDTGAKTITFNWTKGVNNDGTGTYAEYTNLDYDWTVGTVPDASTAYSSYTVVSNYTDTTVYGVRLQAMRSSLYNQVTSSYTGWYYFVVKPPVPSSGVSGTRSEDSNSVPQLSLSWGSSSGASTYTLRYKESGGSYQYVTVASTSYTLTGLKYGTTYYVSACANNVLSSAYTSENTITTAPQKPTISLGANSASIQINIGAVSGGTSKVIVYRYTNGGTLLDWITSSAGGSATFTVANNGLVQGTTYQFRADNIVTTAGGDVYNINPSSALFVTFNGRPTDFNGFSGVYSGGATYNSSVICETASGITARVIKVVSASDWNNLCTAVTAFREYVQLSLPPVTLTTVSAYVSPTNQGTTLSANLYNTVRGAVWDMNSKFSSTYRNNFPSAVSSGNTITAYHLTALRDAMKSIT